MRSGESGGRGDGPMFSFFDIDGRHRGDIVRVM